MIRIISGIHKGRRLRAPKNLPVRPTTDRAKEALFNILAHQIYWKDARILDLFAGTGNISYECASRGCLQVIAVDAHAGCVKFIEHTAAQLKMPVIAYKREVVRFLRQCDLTFSLIFADPPYEMPLDELTGIVSLCQDRNLLEENGVLVIEHSPHRDLSTLDGFQEVRKYGNTLFSFFNWENKKSRS